MFRWGRASIAYALIAGVAVVIGFAFDRASLLRYENAWLSLSDSEAHLFSLVLGVAFAVLVVVGTRLLVAQAAWARNLHRDLRPLTLRLDLPGILAVAVCSAVAEELVFRGLLMPWLGLVPQAILFGVAHAQLSGPSRWVWVAWATVVGLALGAICELTGSLLGPMLSHALINGLNLAYLKSHDTAPPRRALGGLLSDRQSPVPPDRRSLVPEAHASVAGRRPAAIAGRRA